MSKKNKSGLDWLDRTLFASSYCFALCTSEKKFHAELKRLGVPRKDWPEFVKGTHSNATVHFLESGKAKRCAIVCMAGFEDKERSAVYGLLVHEAVHIWQAVKCDVGEKYPSDEFEAYSIQALSQRLIEAFDDEFPMELRRKK